MARKGNYQTLECSDTFIIYATEIILSRSKRPDFWFSSVTIFVKFEEKGSVSP